MENVVPKFIEKDGRTEDAEDFELLVQHGVALLQKLSGRTWTDYNIHDPGVTILEQLCFAFTDLAYRTGFDIEDILTDPQGYIDKSRNSFFDREKILSCNPVTINDYRKVILDEVEEVDNVQLIPVVSAYAGNFMRGLYKVVVQVSDSVAANIKSDKVFAASIEAKIKNSFLSHRNLSEDMLRTLVVLSPQQIKIHANIIMKENMQPEEVMVRIYNRVQAILAPRLQFNTEQELLAAGMKPEEIYQGPLLRHGIILDSGLRPMITEIDNVELARAISQVEGVLFVKQLLINDQKDEDSGKPFQLDENCFPFVEKKSFAAGIDLYVGEYKINVKEKTFLDLLEKSNKFAGRERKNYARPYPEPKIKKGNWQNVAQYFSIQNNFPVIYGIGPGGLSVHDSELRKAQARQLKAYLLFFEQVLANYLQQLASVSDLFSTQFTEEKEYSYYFQPLYDVPGIKDILQPKASEERWEAFKADADNPYMQALKYSQESVATYRERKNKIFDHLFARFNKRFVSYPVMLYENLYGSNDDSKPGLILKWKAEILRRVAEIDYSKVKAFNYLSPHDEISGYEKKMAMFLHIGRSTRQPLSAIFDNGKIAFVSEKKGNQFRAAGEGGTKNVTWGQERLDIFAGVDEIIELSELGKLIAGGINQKESYMFRKQGMSVLRHGLNIENYRIGPSINHEGEYIIIYKEPSAEKWTTVSRHPDKASAIAALDKLVAFFRKISVESEGFHVMEHLLLRPELNQKSFGFRFCTNKDNPILENNPWTDFEAREKTIGVLLKAAESPDRTVFTDKISPVTFRVKTSPDGKSTVADAQSFANIANANAAPGLKNLVAELEAYRANSTNFYPRFEMLVRLPGGKVLKEDFFNFRVTVVLPAWPARFQEPEFRSFTEDLFRLSAPAYLRMNFLWLNLQQMKTFEENYFSWLNSFRHNDPYEKRSASSEQLAMLLGAKDYIVPHDNFSY